jgi:hypothetical protein
MSVTQLVWNPNEIPKPQHKVVYLSEW